MKTVHFLLPATLALLAAPPLFAESQYEHPRAAADSRITVRPVRPSGSINERRSDRRSAPEARPLARQHDGDRSYRGRGSSEGRHSEHRSYRDHYSGQGRRSEAHVHSSSCGHADWNRRSRGSSWSDWDRDWSRSSHRHHAGCGHRGWDRSAHVHSSTCGHHDWNRYVHIHSSSCGHHYRNSNSRYGYGRAYGNYSDRYETRFGFVDIDISPDDADVYIDGEYVGQADDFDGNPGFLALVPGRHELEIRVAGLPSFLETIRVAADHTIELDFDLADYE